MKGNKEYDVAIIGAGLTGLTAAHHLQKKNIIILDESDKPGGVIKTRQEDGFTYELGPNTGVLGTPEIVELFEQVGHLCEVEMANETNKKRYILKDSEWVPLPGGIIQGITTPLFSFTDKIKLLGEPFRRKGKNPDESLSELVKRRMGKSFLDYAVDPFILGVYAGDPEVLIPQYALPKLYNLEQNYGSFIGGTIKKQREKKTPLEKKANRKVFSVKGGLSNLVNALYESIGKEKFIFNAENVHVNPESENFDVHWESKGKQRKITAKKVISTVGAYKLPDTFSFLTENDLNILTNLHYAKVVEVSVGFKNWQGMILDGFGGLIPSKENRDILGILFLSSQFSGRAPKGGALISIFIGGSRKEHLANLGDYKIRDLVRREVTDLLQLTEFKPDLFHISRYKHAIPQYDINSGNRFETIKKIEALYPGLQLGGNMRDGIGMADRVKQGKMLAMQALGN